MCSSDLGAVIDEVQHAPALLSQLQSVVDADGRMGLFALTGSQNLSLLAHLQSQYFNASQLGHGGAAGA